MLCFVWYLRYNLEAGQGLGHTAACLALQGSGAVADNTGSVIGVRSSACMLDGLICAWHPCMEGLAVQRVWNQYRQQLMPMRKPFDTSRMPCMVAQV